MSDPSATQDEPDLAQRMERALWRCSAVAAASAIAWLVIASIVVAPLTLGTARGFVSIAQATLGVVSWFLFAAVLGSFTGRKQIRSALAWLIENRSPTVAERARVLALPRRRATHDLLYWVGAAAWAIPFVFVVYRGAELFIVTGIAAYCVAALLGWTLCFFLAERALRPARAVAAAAEASPTSKTMSIFRRLVFVWIVSSALPLACAAAMMTAADQTPTGNVALLIWGVCGTSALAGIFLTSTVARAVSEPLERVRTALGDIAHGSLDVHLAMDESGELGALQTGFNRMVTGLRERERMRDLFGRHVGAEVVTRALERGPGLGGETCQATAMFVDMIGSTALAQQETADQVVEVLNRFFRTVVGIVTTEQGVVNQFQGDGALCLFGTPVHLEDHAARALRAAEALQLELAIVNDVRAAIGISSGEVVAGNVGTSDRYEFTAIGDPVNEAARLCEAAKVRATRVLASSRTIDAAGEGGRGWKPARTIELRGRSEPTQTYEPHVNG